MDKLAAALLAACEHSLDGIVITDEQTNVLKVNSAYERLTGYAAGEIIGRKVNIVRSGRTPPETYGEMWRSVHGEGCWRGELIDRRPNGQEWRVQLSITAVELPDQGRFYVGILRDVTDLRSAQDELRRSLTELRVHQEVTVKMLARVAEHQDPLVEHHLETVQNLSVRIALAMRHAYSEIGIDDKFVADLRGAVLLHDIGKLYVPERILYKPGRLTQAEFELMKAHTTAGFQLLDEAAETLRQRLGGGATFLDMARDIARSHHERWDGKGYPDRLAGEAIPLAARITAVADVYDALVSKRVYKDPWREEEAARWVEGESGRAFDPKVVSAFSQLEKLPHRGSPREAEPS